MGYKVKRIYVGTNLVRPSWWKPTNNTIAYYEFNNNLNDSINNAHPLSLSSGGTAQYSLIGGRKCFLFNGSTYLSATPMVPPAGPFTISVRYNMAVLKSGQAAVQQFNSSTDNSALSIASVQSGTKLACWSKGSNDWTVDYTIAANVWYNIILTYTSGTLKMYVNGALAGTKSRTINTKSPNQFWIGRSGETSGNDLVSNGGKVSEVIIENKQWNATEVSNYYNLTKSNYGL